MIPLQALHTPKKRLFPFVNIGLILANIVVFIRELTLPPAESNCFVYAYSFDPKVVTGHLSAPAAYLQMCQHSAFHPPFGWLTVLTAMFLHASILHIAGNMLFLFIFGDNVEDRFGHIGYLLFYFVCGIAAAIAQIVITPLVDLPNLGASGAIAGVLGAYLVLFPQTQVRTLFIIVIVPIFTRLSAVLLILLWFALQLLNGYLTLNSAGAAGQGGVAYFAHIGGFLTGFVLTLLLRPRLTQ